MILLGPRQCGKSTWIQSLLVNEKYFIVDLLSISIYKKYKINAEVFFDEMLYQIKEKKIEIIFVDEIQKIPELLNEIHRLIELKLNCSFILSGSSARKLRRGGANMLGGRAIIRYMFPFTWFELQNNFDLERTLQYGLICGMYFDDTETAISKIQAYVDLYIKEEIIEEGVIRQLTPFYRFLDLCGQYTSEIVNYSNIARESHTTEKTIKSYFQILEDTLIGYFLPSYDVSVKRSLSKHPKFYFFDNAVSTCLNQRLNDPLSNSEKGVLFEQFLINQFKAYISYSSLQRKLSFWRTSQGDEVDLIIAQGNKIKIAIEIKYMKQISKRDIKSVVKFQEEHPLVPIYILCLTDMPYKIEEITIIGWKDFLKEKMHLI